MCVHLATDMAECRHRVTHRKNHPTLSGAGGVKIAQKMWETFVAPSSDEGFDEVIVYPHENAANELLLQWGAELPQINPIPANDVLKFPRTSHLLDLGAASRDDKVLESSAIKTLVGSGREVCVEEKLDGANMGVSITEEGTFRVQNRSHVIDAKYHEQFKPLDKWLAQRGDDLWSVLEPGRHVLYGEWLHATHAVKYDRLPDLFMAFDLFDRREDCFVDRATLEARLAGTQIHVVPLIHRGRLESMEQVRQLAYGPSAYNEGVREGIYLRYSEEGKVTIRCKVVRGDFKAGNENWGRNRGRLETNSVAS